MTRQRISYVRRGKIETENNIAPTETLLDYLRLRKNTPGVKEGCCEGDCGACTVALGAEVDGQIVYSPVNACIYPVGMIDGKEVVTAADLKPSPNDAHPVQTSMVECHGSQCGFCTPGIVMSLFAHWHNSPSTSREEINNCLSGNLCRCTGYRPIVDAAKNAFDNKSATVSEELWPGTAEKLKQLKASTDSDLYQIGTEDSFFASPASIEQAIDLYRRHPDATLVAGATDVGLWVTKHLKTLPKVIWLGRCQDLLSIADDGQSIMIGAAVTYENAYEHIASIHPDIDLLLRRLGSRQVRASGTIGGNVANGSPIGDTPPVLIALDATLQLQSSRHTRTLPIKDFFIRYGKQDIADDEILTHLNIPRLKSTDRFACGKISKRFDQDISGIMGAVKVTLNGAKITDVRIAFGGMAETPKRAYKTEQALIHLSITDESGIGKALTAIFDDFDPITDMRASAEYRRSASLGFLIRSFAEFAGSPNRHTRIHAFEGASA